MRCCTRESRHFSLSRFSESSTHRPVSSSFLGLPHILNMNHKKELLRGLWVVHTYTELTPVFSTLAWALGRRCTTKCRLQAFQISTCRIPKRGGLHHAPTHKHKQTSGWRPYVPARSRCWTVLHHPDDISGFWQLLATHPNGQYIPGNIQERLDCL